jgi:hypothetical protein
MEENYFNYRRLIKEDGTRALSFNNKLHSWDEPQMVKKNIIFMGLDILKNNGKNLNLTGMVCLGIKTQCLGDL